VLYTNGVVWTGDPANPWAEALLVEDGVVAVVGPRAALAARNADATVDLDGAFLCPGLVDAHTHVLGFGLSLDRADLVGAASLEETLDRVQRFAVRRREEGFTGWIRGRGWDQNDWPVTAFPSAADLDAVTGNAPAALTRIDGHALWVNSRALALAGITADTPDPSGGRIHRDGDGRPTGILVDTAKQLVTAVIPDTDDAAKAAAIRRAVAAMAEAGLTGVHDMGMSAGDLAVYRRLNAEEALGVRIYGAISVDDPDLERVLAAGPDRDWGSGTFRLGMVKIYMDGALGSRGAALLAPYSDEPGNDGLLITSADTLRGDMERALGAGFQCAVHAIGDRANRIVLDVWEAMGEADASRVPPAVRLEHAQIVDPRDIPRVGALGVVASMQPTHCTSDMPWAPARLGRERLAGAYAWRSLIDAGALFAAGSDFPIESHDPRFGLFAAVTRRAPGSDPASAWSPEERLSREEALAAFTAAPAAAAGDGDRLGTLAPGKLADFTVFDTNLVTCDPDTILTARTLLTAVRGRPVYVNPEAPFAQAVEAADAAGSGR
jgi:predicted amidohydrolase YtcJ